MRVHLVAAGAALVMLAAPVLRAQAPSSDAKPPGDEPWVYVVRNDRGILKSSNADALIRKNIVEPALHLADAANWRMPAAVRCKKPPCSAEAVVDAFFDYYEAKFPTTARKLSDWVRYNNAQAFAGEGAEPGREIVLPCLPASPQQGWKLRTGSRLVIPCQETARGAAADRMTVSIASSVPILEEDPRREVNESIERMTLAAYRLAFPEPPAENVARIVTARADFNDPESRLMDVKFLGPPEMDEDVDCRETPFRSVWERRLTTLNLANIEAIATEKKCGLVLIDWDFLSGHGKQVRAVARRMLQCLKLDNRIDPAILDLHPRRNTQGLEDLVRLKCRNSATCTADKASHFAKVCEWRKQEAEALPKDRVNPNAEEGLYLDALCWIQTTEPPEGLNHRIDQYVLKAVFEDTLSSGSWMNLSFDMRRDQAESIRQSIEQRSGSPSMIFAAAGNSGTVSVDVSPQGMARDRHDRVVNVTFGTATGEIGGAISARDASEVAVLAPGTGFRHQDIPFDSVGSSFASPWVATAAWVKRLIDETGRKEIRGELIRASRPVRSDIFSKVVSGGFFDPYLLLANDGRRILTAEVASTAVVVDGRIDFNFFMPFLNPGPLPGVVQFCGQMDADYAFYKTSDGKTMLWRRPREEAGLTLEVENVRATLLHADQVQPEVLEGDAFLAKYGEFTTKKACP